MKIILNADDFGLRLEVNRGVAECFQKGLCSSATIMATMPGFEDACQLAEKTGMLGRLGVHLVLNQGMPLTEEIKKIPRFCNRNGLFDSDFPVRGFRLKKDELCAAAGEIRAQIRKVKDAGIIPTHIDSHLHLHLRMDLIKVVAEVSREEGVFFIRPMRNVSMAKLSVADKLKIRGKNLLLHYVGMSSPNYYTYLEEGTLLFKSGRKFPASSSMEINFHPSFDPAEGLVNLSFGNKDHGFAEQIKSIVKGNQIISYAALSRVFAKPRIKS